MTAAVTTIDGVEPIPEEAIIKDNKPNTYQQIDTVRLAKQFNIFLNSLLIPIVGIIIFLFFWHITASQVETSLGTLPGPIKVWSQFTTLVQEHKEERVKEDSFYQRQEKRNAKKLEKNPDAKVKIRAYTGNPTFFDQIVTSLITVMTGFLVGSLIAIPLGIACGLSLKLYAAFNPLIQIFKPVSPLAWLPLVTIVVSAIVVSNDPLMPKSFIISAAVVS